MNKPGNGASGTAGRVDALVGGLDLDGATGDEVAAAAAELVALGREGVAHLVRGALWRGGPGREKAAALLGCLAGEAARWAAREIERQLDVRPLNPTEQVWASAVLRRLDEAASDQEPRAPQHALADDLLEDETELLLWREEFASLPHSEQQAVLAPILQDGDPALLRLLEVALSLQSPPVDGAIAAGLSRFATQEALPLLRELLRRPDAAVRKQARASLDALERQGVDARDLFVAVGESDEPVRGVFATVPEGDGRMAVLVARGSTAARIRLVAVVVDPVEAGIATVWGETGLTEADLQHRLSSYAGKLGQRLVRLDLNTAQALVAAAERYAIERGRTLPSDYLVWRRCIGRPKAPTRLPIVFGPVCSRCGARLRGGDILRGGVIAGRAALCARCGAEPVVCESCARPLDRHTDEVFAREGADGAKVEFICARCSQGRVSGAGR